MMKRILSVAMLTAFSLAVIGCEANARVGDPDGVDTTHRDGTDYSKKTTTTREPDGDVKTKTETTVDR